MTTLRRCRICGAVWPNRSHYWITKGGGCKSCGGSPLCDSCGHPRAKHLAVFRKGKRHCAFRAFDLQSLSRPHCDCRGYVPVDGSLSEAAFAQPDTEPLQPLRLADGTRDLSRFVRSATARSRPRAAPRAALLGPDASGDERLATVQRTTTSPGSRFGAGCSRSPRSSPAWSWSRYVGMALSLRPAWSGALRLQPEVAP